jgi:hypothetical protein
MSKLEEIREGWLNYIFDNPEVKELAEKRAEICSICPENKNNICNICKCWLSAKVKSPKSQCPLKKL